MHSFTKAVRNRINIRLGTHGLIQGIACDNKHREMKTHPLKWSWPMFCFWKSFAVSEIFRTNSSALFITFVFYTSISLVRPVHTCSLGSSKSFWASAVHFVLSQSSLFPRSPCNWSKLIRIRSKSVLNRYKLMFAFVWTSKYSCKSLQFAWRPISIFSMYWYKRA
jgi:hypothetical protein